MRLGDAEIPHGIGAVGHQVLEDRLDAALLAHGAGIAEFAGGAEPVAERHAEAGALGVRAVLPGRERGVVDGHRGPIDRRIGESPDLRLADAEHFVRARHLFDEDVLFDHAGLDVVDELGFGDVLAEAETSAEADKTRRHHGDEPGSVHDRAFPAGSAHAISNTPSTSTAESSGRQATATAKRA